MSLSVHSLLMDHPAFHVGSFNLPDWSKQLKVVYKGVITTILGYTIHCHVSSFRNIIVWLPVICLVDESALNYPLVLI